MLVYRRFRVFDPLSSYRRGEHITLHQTQTKWGDTEVEVLDAAEPQRDFAVTTTLVTATEPAGQTATDGLLPLPACLSATFLSTLGQRILGYHLNDMDQ